MSKRNLQIEEPGTTPNPELTTEPAPEVATADPELVSPVIEVTPPIIGASIAHLPDAAEVDPSMIKTNTLTKQGWVLPTSATIQGAG
jgi:hypothetical protein